MLLASAVLLLHNGKWLNYKKGSAAWGFYILCQYFFSCKLTEQYDK